MTRHDDDNYSVSSLGSSGSDRDGGRLQDDLHPHSEVAPTEDETSTKEEPHASISGTESTTTTKTWTPVSLHRMVLLGYAVLFIVIIVALEVLNYLSNRNQGLATVSENLYYLWKFGLTFILIIIIAFWAHVEYSSKSFNFSKAYGSAIVDDELVTLWATSNVNLSYPSATTSDFATQSFFISNSSHRTTTAFDVEVFEASLEDCLSFNAILPEDPEESIDSVAGNPPVEF
ncbi:hypothetical protein GTA08_BOTSDO10934 [Botryosphaeria dothidea]|uniref:Transmembrane protein n=1 Tax=Botryosphaeria dothidea TaxID=55169 RepID=A0A8H4IGQ3_9PEZI|nr:hypothetical protein GTA08_BOTSDO10934 [Botryosphaeria dothidea]